MRVITGMSAVAILCSGVLGAAVLTQTHASEPFGAEAGTPIAAPVSDPAMEQVLALSSPIPGRVLASMPVPPAPPPVPPVERPPGQNTSPGSIGVSPYGVDADFSLRNQPPPGPPPLSSQDGFDTTV
ncbi:hypothetical protein ACL02S_02850 [Nocardia sp. 004]|uniref:hypothetical protein n=1 Tax=Nocardia sp. 004 TaxID=3385978 RepID=UPI00399F0838